MRIIHELYFGELDDTKDYPESVQRAMQFMLNAQAIRACATVKLECEPNSRRWKWAIGDDVSDVCNVLFLRLGLAVLPFS